MAGNVLALLLFRRTIVLRAHDIHKNLYLVYTRYILHSCKVLSPSKTGFIVSAHKLINATLLTLAQATLQFQGESPTYILDEDIHPVIREDEFRQNLRSHSWSVFLFL